LFDNDVFILSLQGFIFTFLFYLALPKDYKFEVWILAIICISLETADGFNISQLDDFFLSWFTNMSLGMLIAMPLCLFHYINYIKTDDLRMVFQKD